MTLNGYDYAWGWSPGLTPKLKVAGASFVVRYVGTSSKCITRTELHSLQSVDIAVGLAHETTGVTFQGGLAAGHIDGAKAAAAAKALGAPDGTVIWFAIDTDTTYTPTLAAYYAGCIEASGAYRARLYAGFKVIHALGHGGHWQTYAWSGGAISAHADLYQFHNGVTIGGVSADKCRTLNGNLANHGGWLTFAPAPVTPAPTPAPVPPVAAPEPPAEITYQGWTYTRTSQIASGG